MGEGYRNINASELPEGITFVLGLKIVANKVASFSAPEGKWGAPYRLVYDYVRKKSQFSRYYNTPDDVPEEP